MAFVADGSRICDANRTALAAIDVNFTLTDNALPFIFCGGIDGAVGDRLRTSGTVEWYWRRVGGTFDVVTSSSEIRLGYNTVLVNGTGPTNANKRTTQTVTSVANAIREHEMVNLGAPLAEVRDEQSGESQIALDVTGAPLSQQYEMMLRVVHDLGTTDIIFTAKFTTAATSAVVPYAPRQRRMFVPGRDPGAKRFTRRRSNAYSDAVVAAPADAAPGWEVIPEFVSSARRVAAAIAAITFAAGIESTFVPPVAAAPTLGFEAQPQPVVKRAAVHAVQESLPARSTAFPFGWQQQPSSSPRRPVLALVQDSTPIVSTTPLAGWQVPPSFAPTVRRASVIGEGWPLDVVALQVTPTWGFEAHPTAVSWRKVQPGASESGPLDALVVAQAPATWGWEHQPVLITTRTTRLALLASGDFDPPAAPAGSTAQWWGETPPPIIRRIPWVWTTPHEPPLATEIAPPVEPPVVLPPSGGGGGMMRGPGSGRFVRVDDGSSVYLPTKDAIAYARLDRPIIGQLIHVAQARAVCDQPVLVAYAALTAHDAVAWAKADQPVLRKDDLNEIARLTKMARAPKAMPADIKAPADVRGIWALIDRMRGKTK